MKSKIKINKVQCPKCKDVIASEHRHDFVWCRCGNVAIDGGKDYIKRSAYSTEWKELSEYCSAEEI